MDQIVLILEQNIPPTSAGSHIYFCTKVIFISSCCVFLHELEQCQSCSKIHPPMLLATAYSGYYSFRIEKSGLVLLLTSRLIAHISGILYQRDIVFTESAQNQDDCTFLHFVCPKKGTRSLLDQIAYIY